MLPALTVIISVYCCIRLLGAPFAMAKDSPTPRVVFLGLAVLGCLVIAFECWAVMQAGSAQASTMQNLGQLGQ